jgi:hypothetical protein
MSVSIATMGMFRDCCGGAPGGGGAPPYRQNYDEQVKPVIFVRNVEMTSVNPLEESLSKVKVMLLDDDD